MPSRPGPRSAAQTPAPRSERIKGSSRNPPGSASETSSQDIELSDAVIEGLTEKMRAFNEEHPGKRVSLGTLKKVFRRGAGAFSSSHRPGMTRNGWAYARVNAFLRKRGGGKAKAAYVQDDDLMADGGEIKLLAPNGQPSNLTPEQYRLVRTPQFKAWFGDWEHDPENASKVVDENMEPLVVYHGGGIGYTQFQVQWTSSNKPQDNLGSHFGTYKAAKDRIKKSGFFRDPTKSYIYPVFLNIRKLWKDKVFSTETEMRQHIKNFIIKNYPEVDASNYTYLSNSWVSKEIGREMGKKGIGVAYRNSHEDRGSISWIATKREQIKLADGSNTTFDPENPDIRYADGGFVEKNCREYIAQNEAVLRTGYYLDLKELSSVVDPYGQVPLNLKYTLVTYNSGNQETVELIDTINPVSLRNELAKVFNIPSNNAAALVSTYIQKGKKLKAISDITGDDIVIFDRDRLVCINDPNSGMEYAEGGDIHSYPAPPLDKSDYVTDNEYWSQIHGFYDGISSRFHPYTGPLPPLGTWRISRMKLLDGHQIDYLTELPLDALTAKELDEYGRLDPMKRGDDERYAQWLREGFRSIPIEVLQHEDGRYVIINGHRRYLAHKLVGKDTIEAWVSYTVQSPRGFPTGLTYELAHPGMEYAKGGAVDGITKRNAIERADALRPFRVSWAGIPEGPPRTIPYRDVIPKIDKTNYWVSTDAIFTEVDYGGITPPEWWDNFSAKHPGRVKGSPLSDSRYIVFDDRVYRYSDHWGRVASCNWGLRANPDVDQEPKGKWAVGVVEYADMRPNMDGTHRAYVLNKEFYQQTAPLYREWVRRIEELKEGPNVTASGRAMLDEYLSKIQGRMKRENMDKAYDDIDFGYAEGGTTETEKPIMLPDTQASYEGLKPILERQGYELRRSDPSVGRLAKGMTLADLALRHGLTEADLAPELAKGIETEMEHTEDPAVAEAIAMDHIYESPDYYTKLQRMETTKYARGGTLNPDSPAVKGYFAHGSGHTGGVLVGKRHSEGGIKAINKATGQPLEMEGGEVVITRDAVSDDTRRQFEGEMLTNREILSRINESGGGVSFEDGGHVCSCSGKKYNYGGEVMEDYDIMRYMAKGGMTPEQRNGRMRSRLAALESRATDEDFPNRRLSEDERWLLYKFKTGSKVVAVDAARLEMFDGLLDDRLIYFTPSVSSECQDARLTPKGVRYMGENHVQNFAHGGKTDCGCGMMKKGGETAEGKTYFKGIDHAYKNQFELNKAIEEFLEQKKGKTYTSQEKKFLSYFAGYGGLIKYGAEGKGILYEYYTPSEIARKMWALAYKYGYNGGPVLEPSVGVGEFLKYAPEDAPVTAYEISPVSSEICRILYPTTKVVTGSFETQFIRRNISIKGEVKSLPKFDLCIGNPPYGEYDGFYAGMGEKAYTNAQNWIDYFILRGLDLLNPQGLLIYIIGGIGKPWLALDTKVKRSIAEKCVLLDAYRLPNGLFDNTEVQTDIIVLQKR